VGTTDSSALFLSAEKKSNVTRVEEAFCGGCWCTTETWMGGKDRGGYGERMCAMGCKGVACGVRGKESSEGHSKGRNNKKRQIRQICPTKKKSKNLHQRSLGESTLDPNQEGSEGLPFNQEYLRKGPTCPNIEHTQPYIGT
jgi:hypothetical protein